jgi:hypothetical protein
MSFNSVLEIIKSGKDILSSESVDRQISAIFCQIKTIYSDISDASIAAAKAALKSENSLHNWEKCIEIAIPHLVAAYAISKKALGLTKKTRFLLLFTSDEYLIPENERHNYLSYTALLSGEISLLYKIIGQLTNAKDWHNVAVSDYQTALNMLYSDLIYLKSLDSSYVNERDEMVDEGSFPARCDRPSTFLHTIEITEKGKRYIDNEKQNKINAFVDAISI